MPRLRIVDQGILYRNPHPGHEAISAIYPVLLPLSDDEIVCFYRVGQALYSLDGRIHLARSIDGGKSWTQEDPIPEDDAGAYTYGTTWATRHRDGTIIQQTCRWPARRETMIRFNPETGGHRPDEQLFRCSRDGGRTWSPSQILEVSRREIADTHSSIHELTDGRWMQVFETWKGYDDPAPLHITGFTLFSEDRGKTWGGRVEFPSARDTRRMYSHSQYRPLRDGGFVATQWAQDVGGQVNHDLHLVFGDATGTRWTTPLPTGLIGQSSCTCEANGGELVCTYSLRVGRTPGIMVAMSRDRGANWDVDHQAQVWDAEGQEYLGTQHHATYPASHDNAAFGKPDTAILPGGDILSSWWCTQAGVTQVRFARLRIE